MEKFFSMQLCNSCWFSPSNLTYENSAGTFEKSLVHHTSFLLVLPPMDHLRKNHWICQFHLKVTSIILRMNIQTVFGTEIYIVRHDVDDFIVIIINSFIPLHQYLLPMSQTLLHNPST